MKTTTTTKPFTKPFSEVISSTNEIVVAQCYKEDAQTKTPQISIFQGEVVKIISSNDNASVAFGIVTKINNSSIDNIHKPSALGLSPEEIEHLQPQIFELLRKEIEIYLFSYKFGNEKLINESPLRPMSVHDFVYIASDEELIYLSENVIPIANLIKKYQLKLDLLKNLITRGYELRKKDYNYLVKIGKQLTHIFSDEIDSLMLFLEKIAPN